MDEMMMIEPPPSAFRSSANGFITIAACLAPKKTDGGRLSGRFYIKYETLDTHRLSR